MKPHQNLASKRGDSAKADPAPQDKTALDEFARAENEVDDGYDPWSDRPPVSEPLFSENPWD